MMNRVYGVLILIIFFSFFTSCGTSKISEEDMVIKISDKYTRQDIELILRDNNYIIESSSPNKIITGWKRTKVELTTFKVEITQGIGNWKMKGRIKYEAYRDREMDESVYTEEYVFRNSDVFVIKYGWDMLSKIENDLRDQ